MSAFDDPCTLPAGLPVPVDDGASGDLVFLELPASVGVAAS